MFERSCSPGFGAIGRRYRLPGRAEHQEGEKRERDQQDEQEVPAWDEQQDNCEGGSDCETAHGRCSFWCGTGTYSVTDRTAAGAKDAPRYGKGSAPRLRDQATAAEIVLATRS
jgi:hypothetical protein